MNLSLQVIVGLLCVVTLANCVGIGHEAIEMHKEHEMQMETIRKQQQQQQQQQQQKKPQQQPKAPAYDEFFLDLVQDDLNRKLFEKASPDSLSTTMGKSSNLNAKYYGQQQQSPQYNQMASQFGAQQPAEMVNPLAAMHHQPFMQQQVPSFSSPNMMMQQMSKI